MTFLPYTVLCGENVGVLIKEHVFEGAGETFYIWGKRSGHHPNVNKDIRTKVYKSDVISAIISVFQPATVNFGFKIYTMQ